MQLILYIALWSQGHWLHTIGFLWVAMVMCTADVHCSAPPADGSSALCFMCVRYMWTKYVKYQPRMCTRRSIYIKHLLKILRYTKKIRITYVAKSRVKAKTFWVKKKRFFSWFEILINNAILYKWNIKKRFWCYSFLNCIITQKNVQLTIWKYIKTPELQRSGLKAERKL